MSPMAAATFPLLAWTSAMIRRISSGNTAGMDASLAEYRAWASSATLAPWMSASVAQNATRWSPPSASRRNESSGRISVELPPFTHRFQRGFTSVAVKRKWDMEVRSTRPAAAMASSYRPKARAKRAVMASTSSSRSSPGARISSLKVADAGVDWSCWRAAARSVKTRSMPASRVANSGEGCVGSTSRGMRSKIMSRLPNAMAL